MNDFQYQLSELGGERARRHADFCSYLCGTRHAGRLHRRRPRRIAQRIRYPTGDDLERAFGDLVLNKKILDRLGPAINSARGLFSFGPPGNGKTSVAERLTAAFGHDIWIPRALGVDGESCGRSIR